MADTLQQAAQTLLENEEVNIVIGYAQGTEGEVRAHFARRVEDTKAFIFDDRCVQNLAVYLVKGEVKKMGKSGIFATLPTLRSILQVASENQLTEEKLTVLALLDEGKVQRLDSFKEMEQFVADQALTVSDADRELIEKLETMSSEERWAFWQDHFSRCIKCYACRAACPMCYCVRCQADFNQPQLITVEATPLGNFEWHTMRAMHLAGRCVSCGDCGRSCPVGIPVHLLSIRAGMTVKEKFKVDAGTDSRMVSALSTYNVDDQEDFIKHE